MSGIFHVKTFACLVFAISLLPAAAVGDESRGGAVGGDAATVPLGSFRGLAAHAARWHEGANPAERVSWGGLAAIGLLAAGVTLERVLRLRRGMTVPFSFVEKCLDRLCVGEIGREKAIDYCELNPSPASRVALGAIRRWGKGVADVERGAALARQVEAAALRRYVGTLRRIAGIAPLIGLLGTLSAAGRVLAASASLTLPAIGPALAGVLGPLIAGVALAILSLVAYDGLSGKVESLQADLERVIARTVDAVAGGETVRSRGDSAGAIHAPHTLPATQRLPK